MDNLRQQQLEAFIDSEASGVFENGYYRVVVENGWVITSERHTPDDSRHQDYTGRILHRYDTVENQWGIYQVMGNGSICGANTTVWTPEGYRAHLVNSVQTRVAEIDSIISAKQRQIGALRIEIEELERQREEIKRHLPGQAVSA